MTTDEFIAYAAIAPVEVGHAERALRHAAEGAGAYELAALLATSAPLTHEQRAAKAIAAMCVSALVWERRALAAEEALATALAERDQAIDALARLRGGR